MLFFFKCYIHKVTKVKLKIEKIYCQCQGEKQKIIILWYRNNILKCFIILCLYIYFFTKLRSYYIFESAVSVLTLKWSEVKLLSRVRLFATPWTVAYQAPPSMGFSRQECWSGLPFPAPGDLCDPEIKNPGLPHCRQMLYPLSHQGSPLTLNWTLYTEHFPRDYL